ncbi:ferredoxin [Ruegeria sp. HKCCD4332]|uniref:ferredoxin n=1 Tax=Ruegeria sp. HKCCD4332 TaxID=2683021 RepID=UPI00149131C4|nr:ferredoxin [Ruegeria sp. HKCCD4332]NOD75597.1 ferredoxin [Ruegeria sp. HKCCD4332]
MSNLAQPSSDQNAVSYDHIVEAAHGEGLIVMGALHPRRTDAKQLDTGTLVLLGAGGDFWRALKASPEWGAPDPVDRWSTRVIGGMAQKLGAEVYFPFGGPPYAPFIDWALKSGRTFSSPVGALVHDTVGMMISYRGALHFTDEFDIPNTTGQSPCTTCDAPCTRTCPVGALNAQEFYDVSACHSHLDTSQGQTCMTGGCLARLACPLSAGAARTSEQSAHHMRSFHPS